MAPTNPRRTRTSTSTLSSDSASEKLATSRVSLKRVCVHAVRISISMTCYTDMLHSTTHFQLLPPSLSNRLLPCAAKEIDAIIHKSRRKGLRGWIKRGALGVHGEVWGVGDRDAREAQWSAMQDYLSVQLEYTTEPLGRRQESEIRLRPEFSLRDPRRKSIVSLV